MDHYSIQNSSSGLYSSFPEYSVKEGLKMNILRKIWRILSLAISLQGIFFKMIIIPSQWIPLFPILQPQVYPCSVAVQVPPLRHGFGKHRARAEIKCKSENLQCFSRNGLFCFIRLVHREFINCSDRHIDDLPLRHERKIWKEDIITYVSSGALIKNDFRIPYSWEVWSNCYWTASVVYSFLMQNEGLW